MLTFLPTFELVSHVDAEQYLSFLRKLDAESEYMHYCEGERLMDVHGMCSRLKKMSKQQNAFAECAFGLDGSIIGYFSVNGGNSKSTSHSATVAVGVLKAYRGNGIAAQLYNLAACHAYAVGVSRFECTVVRENEAAQAFYLAMGFHAVGHLSKRFRSREGLLLDEWVLECHL